MSVTTDRERLAALGFYTVIVLLAYLVYQLFRPFLAPLAWASVAAICFYPTYQRFERRMRRGPAALLSTLWVALLVIVPMLAVASAFVSEAARVSDRVPALLGAMPGFTLRLLQVGLRYVPGGERIDAADVIADAARQSAAYVSAQAAAVLQNIALFTVDLVVMLFALYFLFRDAPTLMSSVRRIIPLEPDVRERLIEQTRTLVTASVTSSLIVAAIQGLLGGVTFWALGLTAPVFWGVVMGVFCLLPFGAWLVWAPAAIGLMLTGHVVRGLILAGLGAGVISMVDNFLRPVLLSEQTEMNGLLLFISLLGGIVAFGSVGLILGPVLMATAVALFEAFTADAPPPTEHTY